MEAASRAESGETTWRQISFIAFKLACPERLDSRRIAPRQSALRFSALLLQRATLGFRLSLVSN